MNENGKTLKVKKTWVYRPNYERLKLTINIFEFMSAMNKLKLIDCVKYVNFEMQLLMLEWNTWFLQIPEH